MRFVSVVIVVSILTSAGRVAAQNATPAPAMEWRKQVTRTIDMREPEDTVTHHLRQANGNPTLIELIVDAIKAGKLTAYSGWDNQFTTKLSIADVNQMTAGRTDTVVVVDPLTGNEITKVVTRDFDPDMFHYYRILEDWAFNTVAGKTTVQIVGVAPCQDVINEDGTFRGRKSFFWVKFADIQAILAHYAQLNPTKPFPVYIWNDYFLSDIKPTEHK